MRAACYPEQRRGRMATSIGPTLFSNRNVHTLRRARPHRALLLDGRTGSEPTCRLRCALATGVADAIASASTLRLRSAGSESGTPRRHHHRSGDQCRGYGREARTAVEGARSHAQWCTRSPSLARSTLISGSSSCLCTPFITISRLRKLRRVLGILQTRYSCYPSRAVGSLAPTGKWRPSGRPGGWRSSGCPCRFLMLKNPALLVLTETPISGWLTCQRRGGQKERILT